MRPRLLKPDEGEACKPREAAERIFCSARKQGASQLPNKFKAGCIGLLQHREDRAIPRGPGPNGDLPARLQTSRDR